MPKNGDMDLTLKMQRCKEYVQALQEEQKKIQVFQRELPLCLELITQAIHSCSKELSELVLGQLECSELTTIECDGGVCTAVFEEFIPIKKSSSSDEHESCEVLKYYGAENNGHKKKSDWLRSVQLWNQSSDSLAKEDQKKNVVMEIKRKGGAFQPFQKEKSVVADKADSQPLKSITLTPTNSISTAETDGNKRELEQQKQSQLHRKQRRCWSTELHRKFLHALQQLGGSHVATPKQIRDLMKLDGLTNDEVKSHLQTAHKKTSLTVTKGCENPQQPQYMVVEGIWVPSHDAVNNSVYAPVAVQPPPQYSPSEERRIRRCKSPTTSSSTHSTPYSSVINI